MITESQPGGAQADAAPAGKEVVVVREAVGDDLDAVLAVGHRTWPGTYEPIAGPDYVTLGLAKWWTADALIPAIRTGRTLVAEVDGQVVGMAAYGTHDDELVLWKLYVLPAHHSRGIGHLLLEAALDRGRELGHRRMAVSVVEGNDRALGFYERHGFTLVGRESAGSGMPDSIWVAKDLGDQAPDERIEPEEDDA